MCILIYIYIIYVLIYIYIYIYIHVCNILGSDLPSIRHILEYMSSIYYISINGPP